MLKEMRLIILRIKSNLKAYSNRQYNDIMAVSHWEAALRPTVLASRSR